MIALADLLTAYVERADNSGFPDWARSRGWRVVRQRMDGNAPWWFAYDGPRLVAFARAYAPGRRERVLSRIPCATCGALPVGDYTVGPDNIDARRRYACGPHSPIRP